MASLTLIIPFTSNYCRGVRTHRSARTSQCRGPGLEQELKEALKSEPDNVQVAVRLVTLLQTEVPRGSRIQEAFSLCREQARRLEWRRSSDWHLCLLQLYSDYQVGEGTRAVALSMQFRPSD